MERIFGKEKTTDLNCPNCGYYLGQQSLFRFYERKIADWLNGDVRAVNNEGFDVQGCIGFPELTFQVKYSHIYHHDGHSKQSRISWWWNQNKSSSTHDPDYFILIGIQDDGTEHYFLLNLNQWLELSHSNGQSGKRFKMIPKRYSRRGQNPKCPNGYIHENRGWKYEVRNPEDNLVKRVQTYESFCQERLF